MKLRTFRAKTMADALAAVKKDLGKSAVILHTRIVRSGGWLGIGAKPHVEVIASNQGTAPMRARRLQGAAQAEPITSVAGAGAERGGRADAICAVAPARSAVAEAYKRTAGPAAAGGKPPETQSGVAATPPDPLITMPVCNRRGATPVSSERPAVRAVARLAVPSLFAPINAGTQATLEQELSTIKRMVGQVLQSSAPAACAGAMPEALFRHYLQLLEGQVARELADQIVGGVRDELTPAELTDHSIVRQTVLRRLAELIPVADTVLPSSGRTGADRPLTIALVGPTGVGKTTTVAKLAAAYKLRHGKKVALITCDTYRIAAVDQLRTYANIIALPLKVVLTPAEMSAAVESLADADIVLIDTAGRSQHDATRLDELAQFIRAADPQETHLVLSSASGQEVLYKTAERFAALKPNRVIFTKLDEAVNFGVLINVAQRVNARLSFVTTGQEVPDHIEPGRPDRLARLVLDGELVR